MGCWNVQRLPNKIMIPKKLDIVSYCIVLCCIEGVVIAAQCTATFSDLLCSPEFFFREAYIRMELEEIGINAGNWVDLAQDRDYWRALLNAAMNLRVPQAMELTIFNNSTFICH